MTPSIRATLLALALNALVSAAGVVPAAAQARPPADKTLSPYFLVEGGDPAVDHLPLKDTRVDVAITGVIADVTVRQIYSNDGTRPIHTRYVFPASTRAAVYGLTMTVGNVRTVARIRERQQATREFEAATREGKSASLLEQSRPNVFTMRVANVLPGDTIAVELKYTELLVPVDGTYEFVYPTVVGPRYSQKLEADAPPADTFVRTPYTREGTPPLSEFHLEGVVSTGMPIHDLDSPSHRLDIRTIGAGRSELRIDPGDPYGGNRDFILRYRLAGPEIASGLLLFEGEDENFFLLLAEPPQAVAPDAIPPREYIFVIDVSGSMHGFPLDTAKALMGDLATVLRSSDAFNIVVFAGGTDTFAPMSVPASRDNLASALAFVRQTNGGGGTRLLAALERSVAIPRRDGTSRTIVLITDGYIEAEADVFDYVRGQLDDVNFFAFGIGSSVNRYLIEGVARAGLGEPFVVTTPAESPAAAARLRRYIDTPVLTGIDVSFNGLEVYDVEPRRVPDLFASRPIVMFGKWRGRAAGLIEISGRTGRGEYRTSLPVSPPPAQARHAALRHLWARARIADLSDLGPATPSDQRVAEITSLGLTYGLLTRYTSFVAVQETLRNTGGADDVDQPLPLPQGVSDLAVGITSGSEPGLLWLCAILACLGCITALRVPRRRAGAVS